MGAARNRTGTRQRVRPYRCFLLRCWLEEGALPAALPGVGRPGDTGQGVESAWRFRVQQVGAAAAQRGFTCLRDVVAYIDAELAACAAAAQDQSDGPSHPLPLESHPL